MFDFYPGLQQVLYIQLLSSENIDGNAQDYCVGLGYVVAHVIFNYTNKQSIPESCSHTYFQTSIVFS